MRTLDKENGMKKGKVKIVDAPIAFTRREVNYYAFWLMLEGSCNWLCKPPKDKKSKDIIRDFMAYYAKLKVASKKVEKGKTEVKMNKREGCDDEVFLRWNLFTTPEEEALTVIKLFYAYLASRVYSEALAKVEKQMQEDIDRKDLRIKDLENAVKKSYANAKNRKPVRAKSQGKNRKF